MRNPEIASDLQRALEGRASGGIRSLREKEAEPVVGIKIERGIARGSHRLRDSREPPRVSIEARKYHLVVMLDAIGADVAGDGARFEEARARAFAVARQAVLLGGVVELRALLETKSRASREGGGFHRRLRRQRMLAREAETRHLRLRALHARDGVLRIGEAIPIEPRESGQLCARDEIEPARERGATAHDHDRPREHQETLMPLPGLVRQGTLAEKLDDGARVHRPGRDPRRCVADDSKRFCVGGRPQSRFVQE